jgi:hypothetical protein
MAVAGIKLELDSKEIAGLRDSLRNLFSPKEVAPILGEALEKAIWPAYLRLREVTPFGVTGNLRRAVNHKVKTYPRNGGAVGLIGYNRSGKGEAQEITAGGVQLGPDRAFHQWWLEFGTKRRVVRKVANKPYTRTSKLGKVHQVSGQNSVIASSQASYGPFRIFKRQDGGLATDPQYPKAFFKKAKKGQELVIDPSPRGGIDGQPPVKTAWEQSQSKVAFILQQELRISLERALSSLNYSGTGTVSGTP